MPTRRRKLQRLPTAQLTPEVAWSFEQCRKLQRQCTCKNPQDECKACKAWWQQQTIIHHALRLPPFAWPCLPDPNGPVSKGARQLFEELEHALFG
jgi:hypothetical protein